MAKNRGGWFFESHRHSLAARGIKTVDPKMKILELNGMDTKIKNKFEMDEIDYDKLQDLKFIPVLTKGFDTLNSEDLMEWTSTHIDLRPEIAKKLKRGGYYDNTDYEKAETEFIRMKRKGYYTYDANPGSGDFLFVHSKEKIPHAKLQSEKEFITGR